MNAKEILKAWLTERGYDGLWNSEQECACLLGNLAPCESDPGNCEPGYKVTCDHPRCDSCRESGWHMQPQKPTGEKLTAVDNETAELRAERDALRAELNPPFAHRAACDDPEMGVMCLNCQDIERKELRAEAKAWKDECGMADGCLDMIKDDLIACGEDMSATPPMAYNDALRCVVGKLKAKVEELTRALVRYGSHHLGCRINTPGELLPEERVCTCGFEAALDAAKTEPPKQKPKEAI